MLFIDRFTFKRYTYIMKSKLYEKLSLAVIVIMFVLFVYGVANAILIVDKRQVGTDDGFYTNRVKTSPRLETKAVKLTEGCQSELCKVSRVLDYVTGLEYKIHKSVAYSPHETMDFGYGDCDDKSNLLISLLRALDVESYFVLVPEHIFVIVSLDDLRIAHRKGLWVNGKKYYILESTAKDSPVGFRLEYKLDEIDTILDPFKNEKLELKRLAYRS